MALTFVAPVIAADSGAFKSGSAGVVAVKPGQPIEIRALLSDMVAKFSYEEPGLRTMVTHTRAPSRTLLLLHKWLLFIHRRPAVRNLTQTLVTQPIQPSSS